MLKFSWKRGDKAKIAELLNLQAHHLTEILNRSRGVSQYKALDLETASAAILSEPIPWDAWFFNKSTVHPAFKGRARK